MHDLQHALQNSDDGLLPALAQIWGVETDNRTQEEMLQALGQAMTQPEQAEVVWDMLSDDERGALQLLISSGRKMSLPKFEVAFGRIRKMGRGAIEREQPHRKPQSPAEGLFYRGLISQTFEHTDRGARPVVFTPQELVDALPVHRTSYTDLDAEPAPESALSALDEDAVQDLRPADTSIVDDLTTLLAYLRIHGAAVQGQTFAPADRDALMPHMLTPGDERLAFLLAIGIAAELITTQEGRAYPRRAGLQPWLNAPRHEQVRALAEAWRESAIYRELWHVPGLFPEPGGWPYDALVARQAIIGFIEQFAPADGWWSVDEFIETVKAVDPDFQRPGGDYESWYIRSAENEYLHGFESWDAVEGALLEFIVLGPMHWLGLVDVGADAARLTAYGRAFIGVIPWPARQEQDERILIEADGSMLASRRVPRVDRFQLARFTTWRAAGTPYEYHLDAKGLEQAARQGITTDHIRAFLKRHLEGRDLPTLVDRLLDTWQTGPTAEVTFERLLVLRTHSPETLEKIYEEPALRRHLGARLGPMACVIRPGQEDALEASLGEMGIHVEILG